MSERVAKTNPGNFFEDFERGSKLVHAVPRTITEGDCALYIALTPADLARINAAFPPEAVAGPRYPEGQMQAVNR